MVGIEPMAATVPYHTCPGNHEDDSDFLQVRTVELIVPGTHAIHLNTLALPWPQYRSRFAHMPRGTANTTANSTYHSFNVGLFHVVMFSSEAYFTLSPHGMLLLPDQYAWLEADLAAVDRAVTPWVVTMAHQPAYCSPNDDDDDCHSVVSLVRDGILGAFGLEALLLKYGVEIHFGAHEHALERTYPVGPSYAWDTNRTGPGAYVDFEVRGWGGGCASFRRLSSSPTTWALPYPLTRDFSDPCTLSRAPRAAPRIRTGGKRRGTPSPRCA